MNIAETIRDQIGNRALFMLGARDLMATKSGLRFKVGRNAEGVTHLEIRLNANDTYFIDALRIRGGKVKLIHKALDVYVDSLHRTIERLTGMATSL